MRIEVDLSISESFSSWCQGRCWDDYRKMNEKTVIDELVDIFKIFDKDDDGYLGKF
jgi:hypothetical protein